MLPDLVVIVVDWIMSGATDTGGFVTFRKHIWNCPRCRLAFTRLASALGSQLEDTGSTNPAGERSRPIL